MMWMHQEVSCHVIWEGGRLCIKQNNVNEKQIVSTKHNLEGGAQKTQTSSHIS